MLRVPFLAFTAIVLVIALHACGASGADKPTVAAAGQHSSVLMHVATEHIVGR